MISKKSDFLDDFFLSKGFQLIFSEELLTEFIDVVSREKFRKYFSQDDIEQLLFHFQQYGKTYSVSKKVEVCRDHKDNFLLALASVSQADFLVTGDKDLLVLKTFEQTPIINWSDFVNELKKHSSK